MNNKKMVGDRTEPQGTPLLMDLDIDQWASTTAAIERSERQLKIREQREG